MLSDYKPLIKNSKFIYLWNSQILSQLTIQILNFLIMISLFEKTGSTIATSLLWVSYALPAILIGPFAAASVDMMERRKILMVTNFLQAGVIFFFALFHQASLLLIYGVVMAYSFLNQFYVPAEVSSLPSLVDRSNFARANALFFITQQASLIVGFGVAGFLLKYLGYESALLFCSIALFVAFISVSLLPKMKPANILPEGPEKAIRSFFVKIGEGYNFLKKERSVLAPFCLLVGVQIASAIAVVNLPLIAREVFKIELSLAGISLVVPGGLGALFAALIIPKILARGVRKIRVIENSLLILSISLFVLTFLLSFMPLILKLSLIFFTLMIMGFCFLGIVIPSQTLIQEKTPGGFRGRVFGNFGFIVTILTIFPVIVSGTLSEFFGGRFLLFILGLGLFSSFYIIRRYGRIIMIYGFHTK